MIGVTQLLNSRLTDYSGPGSTASDPFTSFSQVASAGLSNGYYYYNDGQRTRQYYFDVDGTENGVGSGAWARIDATWATLGGEGGEPAPGYPQFDSDGTIGIACLNNNGGTFSANHGGARTSSNTPFRAKAMAFSNMSFTSNGSWGGVTFPNARLHIQDDAVQTFTMTNPNASYYPGWYPDTRWGDTLVWNGTGNLAYLRQDGTVPTSTTSFPTDGSIGFAQGIKYNLASSAHNKDLIWSLGVGSYSAGENRPVSMKMWFQHN